MATATLLTIEDFERLPAELAENHELVDGELVDVLGNNPEHNGLRDFLSRVLWPFVVECGLGWLFTEQEYDFEGSAHGPDVTFFASGKVHLLDRKKRVQRFVPDLAVEIASPSDTYEDLMRKKNRYLRCGTKEVWLISPESRDVTVYTALHNTILRGGDVLSTTLIPGFSITVDELFRRADPTQAHGPPNNNAPPA